MRAMSPARWLWARAGGLMLLAVAALLLASAAAAQTDVPAGDPKAEETAPAAPGPTEAATAVPTNGTGTGGIVGPAPTEEPAATEPGDVEGIPGGSEGTPTEGSNEGVAPAEVVVVLWTSDGGPVSDRTTVCVSEICQPVGAVASGAKIEFPRIVQGWHEITVSDAGPYEDGFSSVSVRPGQRATAELTLARLRQEAPTPPPLATGPIRQPVQAVDGDDDAAADQTSSAQFTTSLSGGDDAALRVTSLPETGTRSSEREGGVAAGMLVIGAALLLSSGAALTWRRPA